MRCELTDVSLRKLTLRNNQRLGSNNTIKSTVHRVRSPATLARSNDKFPTMIPARYSIPYVSLNSIRHIEFNDRIIGKRQFCGAVCVHVDLIWCVAYSKFYRTCRLLLTASLGLGRKKTLRCILQYRCVDPNRL